MENNRGGIFKKPHVFLDGNGVMRNGSHLTENQSRMDDNEARAYQDTPEIFQNHRGFYRRYGAAWATGSVMLEFPACAAKKRLVLLRVFGGLPGGLYLKNSPCIFRIQTLEIKKKAF